MKPNVRPVAWISLMAALSWMVGPPMPASACGPDFPHQLLEDPAAALLFPPELAFAAAVARIAVPPSLRFAQVNLASTGAGDEAALTALVERSDVDEVLRAGGVAGPRRAQVKLMLTLVRAQPAVLGHAAAQHLPQILPREMVLYAQGAAAYGATEFAVARTHWEAILALPATERRYRATWAAFMLAKLGLLEPNVDQRAACRTFEQVRELAAQGALDTLGLALTSLGEQARCAYSPSKPARAGELYLQQAAHELAHASSQRVSGSPAGGTEPQAGSGVVSLGWWVHDLFEVGDAMFTQDYDHPKTEADTDLGLADVATSPQLVAVVTAYLAAQGGDSVSLADPRAARWLRLLEARSLDERVDLAAYADHMALLAYRQGEMALAARWLTLLPVPTPLGLTVQGKLAAYRGQLVQARALYLRALFALGAVFQPDHATQADAVENHLWDGGAAARRLLMTDVGVLAVLADDYDAALEALREAGYWMDASFVAERLLSLSALRAHVDRQPPAVAPSDATVRLRYLLARRLMREGQVAAAKAYMPAHVAADYEAYVALIGDATKAQVARDREAVGRSLAARARLLRHKGMELMGTEGEPDWAMFEGQYYLASPTTWLYAGKPAPENDYVAPSLPMVAWSDNARLAAAPSARALRRIAATAPAPNQRFHYRHVAADLAWEAAQRLPDGSDELSTILCDAYQWHRHRSPGVAKRFYREARRRTSAAQRDACGY